MSSSVSRVAFSLASGVHSLSAAVTRKVNFAARIRTPITFEVGFGDNVCPPQCGYAAYYVCPSRDKQILHGIGQGHAVSGEMYGRLAKWRNGK